MVSRTSKRSVDDIRPPSTCIAGHLENNRPIRSFMPISPTHWRQPVVWLTAKKNIAHRSTSTPLRPSHGSTWRKFFARQGRFDEAEAECLRVIESEPRLIAGPEIIGPHPGRPPPATQRRGGSDSLIPRHADHYLIATIA